MIRAVLGPASAVLLVGLASGAVSIAAAAPPPRAKAPDKQAPARGVPADVLANLEFRSIGPAIMGGRIDDFAVAEGRPSTFYVAAASGGLWKTVNNGVTLEPVFEGQDGSRSPFEDRSGARRSHEPET